MGSIVSRSGSFRLTVLALNVNSDARDGMLNSRAAREVQRMSFFVIGYADLNVDMLVVDDAKARARASAAIPVAQAKVGGCKCEVVAIGGYCFVQG